MGELKVSVVLHQEGSILAKWEENHQGNLCGLLDAVKSVKQSVNDQLSDLILKQKGTSTKSEITVEPKVTEADVEEDANAKEDLISGFIKNVASTNEKTSMNFKKSPRW